MEIEDRCEVLENFGTAVNVEPTTPVCNGDSGMIAISPLCDHFKDQKMRNDTLTTCSDEEIIESLYQNLFSIVLSLQIEESGNGSGSGSHTPLSADCPGAPMKLTKLSRTMDPRFQRKLF
ncbi:unnamed protein product [Microthlaspi erraticum]|uniref:Uncharacterized protein n=1 Tax=Microthlaspi erraticum TaxID=1685480 RepID=A0A6D2IF94_9BRAS|nr:unnamed protein product [Microthlaspi erraticum]